MARARFKASFQAKNREEFKRRMRFAEALYQRLVERYDKTERGGLASRARARASFATFWINDEFSQRQAILERVVSQVEDAARQLQGPENRRELGEAHRDLLNYFLLAEFYDTNWLSRKERFEKVLEVSEKAIEEFEGLDDADGDCLAECLSITVHFLAWLPYQVLDPSSFPSMAGKARELYEKLARVSAKAGTPFALCLAKKDAGTLVFLGLMEGDHYRSLDDFEDSTMNARATGDAFVLGWVCDQALSHASWLGVRGENVERRQEMLEKGISIGSEGISSLEIPFEQGLLGGTYDFLADCYTLLSNHDESVENKRLHLRKAIEIAKKGAAYSPLLECGRPLSRAMVFLAGLEATPEKKRVLLRDAMQISSASVRAVDKIFGPQARARGVYRTYLAQVKAELARVEMDPKLKVGLLEGAGGDLHQALSLLSGWATTSFFLDALAEYEERYGDILLELHLLASTTHPAELAIRAYGDAIAHREKAGLNPSGPTLWKLARSYDTMSDYAAASRAFARAAEDYRHVVKKVPGSEAAFEELAPYLEAWSSIEQARVHHSEEQYLHAAENYDKAAALLRGTREWQSLSAHYSACAHIERGEAFSRSEKPERAIESFTSARTNFSETERDLNKRLGENIGTQEKKELENWAIITQGREKYCDGRLDLEQAKVLDRQGEKEPSSAKYRSACDTFQSLAATASNEQTRRELESLKLFSQACARMKEAEAQASPDLFLEAAELFLMTEKKASREKPRLLALANTSICKALASGTLYRRTRDFGLYSEIKKQLEIAADYYQEADFHNAPDWTRATGRLFDALVYMSNAEAELGPTSKTELYQLAAKHLQLAARLYEQAGFTRKRDEALKHLEKALEEKKLLLTPLDALSENPSSYSSMTPVSLVRDQSLGLERFEGAHVVGNLGLAEREAGVGAALVLELEIANVGKTPAMLLKVENFLVRGLELDRDKLTEKVRDGQIDLKGKMLEYLKTHEVKIPLKAVSKGTFEVRPRVVFVDEKGNHGSYEFGPAFLTVSELGISGWLKGPKN